MPSCLQDTPLLMRFPWGLCFWGPSGLRTRGGNGILTAPGAGQQPVMVLTGAELEPLTEDGYTAVGTDSPSLLNALYLHSPSVRHSGVTAPDLHGS